MEFENFLNRMVEALGIIVDRHPNKRPKKKVDKWLSLLFPNKREGNEK